MENSIKYKTNSIRAFIGAKEFETSKSFYKDLGFEEKYINPKMSLFTIDGSAFYLQDYYVKDWIENSMILLEVNDVDEYYNFLRSLELDKKYPGVKLMPPKVDDWGKECFLIDPSGVLWHIATFS